MKYNVKYKHGTLNSINDNIEAESREEAVEIFCRKWGVDKIGIC